MAFAKGRQPAEETAKNECLRRWPELKLKCRALYWNGRIDGFIIERGEKRLMVAGERSASEAWSTALCVLEAKGQSK